MKHCRCALASAPDTGQSWPTKSNKLGLKRVLVLATKFQQDLAQEISDSLGELSVGVYANAEMHVPIETARDAQRFATEAGADGCIAVGGGSTTGLGKAIALEYGTPIIALPTTYAGSEMTPSLGTDRRRREEDRPRPAGPADQRHLRPGTDPHASGRHVRDQRLQRHRPRRRSPLRARRLPDHLPDGRRRHPRPHHRAAEHRRRTLRILNTAARRSTGPGSAGRHSAPRPCRCTTSSATPSAARSISPTPKPTPSFSRTPSPTTPPSAPAPFKRSARATGAEDPAAHLRELSLKLGAPASLRELGLTEENVETAVDLATRNPYANPREITPEGIRRLLTAALNGGPVTA